MALRRVGAGLFDMALLALPGSILSLYYAPAAVIYIAFFPVLAIFFFAGFHLFRSQTPGKKLCKLRITGQGCILCRELRKCAILFVLLILVLFESNRFTLHLLIPTEFMRIFSFLNEVSSALWLLILFFTLFPLITIAFGKAPHWDRATGFQVVPA